MTHFEKGHQRVGPPNSKKRKKRMQQVSDDLVKKPPKNREKRRGFRGRGSRFSANSALKTSRSERFEPGRIPDQRNREQSRKSSCDGKGSNDMDGSTYEGRMKAKGPTTKWANRSIPDKGEPSGRRPIGNRKETSRRKDVR